MRKFAALAAAAVMCFSVYASAPKGLTKVSAAEANSVYGAAIAGNCVTQGSTFTVCTLNQTCNPNVIPPVTGYNSYYNQGTPTSACYTPINNGRAYCPCGTTSYAAAGVGNNSCFTGS